MEFDSAKPAEKANFIEENASPFLKGILATCTDNIKDKREAVAIHSYPGCIHLKCNKNYRDNFTSIQDLKSDDLIGKASPYAAELVSLMEGKTTYYDEEVKYLDTEGKTSYWTINLILIYEEGQARYLRAYFYNETDRVITRKLLKKQMDLTEEELIKLQMSRELKVQEQVFINTSHELKTPLNLIFSASQLLNVYLKKDTIEDKRSQIARNNEIITKNCYRLTKLINNILDMARIEEDFYELKLDNRDIVSIIDEIVGSVAEYIKDKGMSIEFNSEVKEKIMAFDLYKIERIMLNLISNAIKFSHPNGIIFVNLVDKVSSIEISIKDNGIGVSEEDVKVIFDKFRQVNRSLTRSVEGVGIGLSLAKSLVELHGGQISVESSLGLGSTFTVELPAMIVGNPQPAKEDAYESRAERIKFELSDIYN